MRFAMRLTVWTLGLLAGLLAAPTARADFFEYASSVAIDTTAGSFTPTGSTITGGTTFNTPNGNQVFLTSNSSDAAVPHINAGGIGTDFVPLSIGVNSSFGSESIAFNFELSVTITDYSDANSAVSNGSATLIFTGRIGGSLGDFQTNLDLLSFVPNPGTTTIGNTAYTIDLQNFASPGSRVDGVLTLHASASARSVPEPGSLALFGLGGAGALGMFFRRRIRASS
jgi:hypothetical protein